MSARSYFWTLLARSLVERKARVLVSALTITLGTSVVGGFVMLYSDVERKMSRELRAYGANFVMKPAAGAPLGDDALAALRAVIPADRLVGAQRLVYDVGTLKDSRVVFAGLDFAGIPATTPFWQVTSGAIPSSPDAKACLIGKDLAGRLHLEAGGEVTLAREGRERAATIAAVVETGGAEDDQLFLPFESARAFFSRPGEVDLLAASIVSADVAQADAWARELEKRVRGSRAEPVRKLSRSEGQILSTIGAVVCVVVGFIILSTFVCLLISLMASVSERRKEAALMKALGATDRTVGRHFLAEVTVTGIAGGLSGLALGYALAHLMGRTIFGTSIGFHGWLALPVVASSLLVTLSGAAIPLKKVAGIPPAIVLKGA